MYGSDIIHGIFRQGEMFKSYEHLITALHEFGEWLTKPGNAGILDSVIKQASVFMKCPLSSYSQLHSSQLVLTLCEPMMPRSSRLPSLIG